MASIGEVFLSLGFDVDETTLKDFSDKIGDLQKSMLKLTGVAGGTLYGLMRFAAGTTESATALENLRDLTGENTENVLKWMTAANAANTSISFDGVRESIQSVNQALSDAALGANRNVYMLLGVDWQKDGQIKKGTEFLTDIRRNWESIVKRYQPFGGIPKLMADLTSLGISKGMQQALMLSDVEFESLSKNYLMAQQTIEENKRLGQTINDLQVQVRQIKDNLIGDYAPAITNALKGVVPFVNDLKIGFNELKTPILAIAGMGAILSATFSPLIMAATAIGFIIKGIQLIGEFHRKYEGKGWERIKEVISDDWASFKAYNNRIQPWDSRYQEYSKNIDEAMKSNKYVNQTNNTNFNIYGANDPMAIGDYVKSQLDTENRNTWAQLNNGAIK